jgi:hypothetical protein
MSFVQARVAKKLAQASGAVITNRTESAEWLGQDLPKNSPVQVQPVFSNVGEPDALPGFAERETYVVVFGSRGMKRRLYSDLREIHVQELESVGVKQIVEIGSPSSSPETLYGLPIERRGIQPASNVSSLLLDARGGFLHYPASYLTKSGVWSSYIAHGVPPLIVSDEESTVSIQGGRHYLRMNENALSLSRLRTLGREAWKWYRKNATSKMAARHVINLLARHGFHRKAEGRE